jgi:hypothetical protein
MLDKNHNHKSFLIVLIALFSILILLRLFIINVDSTSHYGLFWAMIYNVIALWGGIYGLYLSRLWGGYKSVLGRTILAFSLGLIAQSFGQNVYNYFYLTQGFDIAVPYPSIGDIGFFGSVLFYIYGVISLAKVSGVKISLASFKNKIQAILIPLCVLIISYYIFLKDYVVDWHSPIKTFLDFGYPLGQAFYVSIAILAFILSRKTLGGIMRTPLIFFLIALIVQYSCDFTFLYQANQGTFVPGGIVDFMYFTSYFIMSLSLLKLGSVFEKIRTS